MGKNWDKLKGHSGVKQDINRRNGEVNGKEGKRLSCLLYTSPSPRDS